MQNNVEEDLNIYDIDVEESMKTSYLDYSMSVIIGRALPNARDGLKPVHRRILYAMNELGITSKTAYKKSARIVGDVIGKYHPHGDSAVYDALVRMAQDFSMRERIVDGQGNFGSIDGDSAAAMRYTEARMTSYAEELLKDIDKDTVDFVANYDDSTTEPEILPSRLPNLLLNGSSGIAVGMATNIPPHNLNELVDALLLLLDDKDISLELLNQVIKGPDFPTGGIIFGKKGIYDSYKTGRGRIKIRAKTHIENKANREIIIIDELPYQTNKARLIEQIASLVKEKIIEGISEIRDESDREGIRVVIELKKDAISEIVLNNLYKSTTMEQTFGSIMLAIENKEPKIFSLLELLKLFLNHRKTIIIRRTIFELQKASARAHILEALEKALANIDEIIRIIKASQDSSLAKADLISAFNFSEIQASAILEMRLSRLTSLERDKLENEFQEVKILIAKLEGILKSEEEIEKIIKEELLEIKSKFSSPRKTEIIDDYDDIEMEDLIPNENMVVTITHRGYIKRVPSKTYEKQKRGGKGKMALTTYEDDFIESFFTCNSHDTLLFISDRGQLYWLKVYKIPEGSRAAKGKAIVNLIDLQADEKIMAIIPTTDFSENKSLTLFTKKGLVKKTNLNEFKNIRSVGIRAINLNEDDELVSALIVEKENFVEKEILEDEDEAEKAGKRIFVVTKKGMCIKFLASSVREIGRNSIGVTAIRFKEENDEVIGAVVIDDDEQEILSISEKGIGKRTEAKEYRLQSRGGKGVICMKLTKKTLDLIAVTTVDETMDLMALTSNGKMIRVDMQSIRKAGRNTSGVKVINVEGSDIVVSIAKSPKEDEEEFEEEGKEDENL